MEKDIIYLDRVLSFKSAKDLYNNYFCWIYPFTNENISGYYSKINFKDKSVLSVIASGDHILNAFLMGANEVDAFDSNPLAKYYVELKIAAIKSLSLEEFILFLYNKSNFKISSYYLNKNVYLKVRNKLSGNYRIFWDYVFDNYTPKQLYKSYLFTDDFLDLPALVKANMYLKEDNYKKLKDILENKKVIYHDIMLQDIQNIDKVFDLIILSNVPAFLNKIYKSNYLKNLKELIEKIKFPNTKIIVSYLYSNLLEYGSSNDDIYNSDKLIEYFSHEDYEYIEFESSDTLASNRSLKKIFPKFDKVFVSK